MFDLSKPLTGLLSGQLFRLAISVFLLLLSSVVLAAPGAHGPDGKHIDVKTQRLSASTLKFETFSEAFELVGEVHGDSVLVYLHEYVTNRPVQANLEIEVDQYSATAVFDASKNSFVISESQLVKQLNQPGDHEILITVLADSVDDLLVASFHVPQKNSHGEHAHFHFPWKKAAAGLLVFVFGGVAGMLWMRRKA